MVPTIVVSATMTLLHTPNKTTDTTVIKYRRAEDAASVGSSPLSSAFSGDGIRPDSDDDEGYTTKKNFLPLLQRTKRKLPSWIADQIDEWGERLCLPEWDEDEQLVLLNEYDHDVTGNEDAHANAGGVEACSIYRQNNFQGVDLCHSVISPARISHYAIQYKDGDSGGIGTTLTGVAHFTRAAESYKGYCHGGSMASVMDDVIGWTAVHVTGQCIPWSGFTAQVNVSLKQPIPVGFYLKIMGEITKTERRKVWISSRLVDGNDANQVYCTAEGLVVLKKMRRFDEMGTWE